MKAIPYGRQSIEQDDIDAVVKTLSGDLKKNLQPMLVLNTQ